MRLKHIKLLLTTCLFILLMTAGKAGADLGVGYRAGGNLSSADEGTNIEMKAEDVVIKLTPALRTKSQDASVPEKMNGYFMMNVEADFTMVNTGAEKETVQTVFPLHVMGGIGRGEKVSKLKVLVDDKEIATEEKDMDRQLSGLEGAQEKSKWAVFDISYDPGQTRNVRVTYEADSSLIPKSFEYTDIGYVLETGADWKGPIGKGTITVEMPFEYSDQYIKLESGGPWQKDGKTLLWRFSDFEPTADDNISVQVRADAIRAYYKKPYFKKVEASSFKERDPAPAMVDGEYVEPEPEKTVRYYPFYAFDSDPTTAWAVYTGADAKPWIRIDFTEAKLINRLDILNGFKSSRADIPAMKGARTLTLEFSDGSQRNVSLKDVEDMQKVTMPAKLTKYLKVTVNEIFASDQRVAFSEISPNMIKPLIKPQKATSFYDSDDFTLLLNGIMISGILMILALFLLLIRKYIRPKK